MIETEATLTVAALSLAGAGLIIPAVDYTLLKRRRYAAPYIAAAALAFSLLAAVLLGVEASDTSTSPVYDGALRVDFYGSFLAVVAASSALMAAIGALSEQESWTTAPSFYSLLLLLVFSVFMLVMANDLALVVAAWALLSVASYFLASIRKDENSVEGATKYALMGVAASAFLIYGVGLVYNLTGTTSLERLPAWGETTPLMAGAALLLVVAFGFKMGIVPFHGWVPDLYGGVHPLLVASLAGVVKVAAVAVLIRVVYPLAQAVGGRWFPLFALLSLVTMTFGNVVALVQRSVPRLMAYSSIAHAGYILLGFAAANNPVGGQYGVGGVALHVATYMFITVGVFSALAYLQLRGVTLTLDGLRGLGGRMPLVSASLTVLLLSAMGLPPFLGFWSKLYLFISVFEDAPWLTLAAILNSALSVGYYAQIIRHIFSTGTMGRVTEGPRTPYVAVTTTAAVASIILGLGPAPLALPLLRL